MDESDPTSELPPYLAAAKRAFRRYGVQKTTLDDIAKEAGVSRSTLYRTHGSKTGILEAMAAAHQATFLADLDRSIPAGTPVRAALRTMARKNFESMIGDPSGAPISRDEPESMLRVLYAPPGGPSPFTTSADLLGAILADRCPDADRLRVTPQQAAELVIRLSTVPLLTDSSRFTDARSILDECVEGLTHRQRRTGSTGR